MPVREPVTMTLEEYMAEAERRFGPDRLNWRWVCPACHHVASAREYKDAGAPSSAPGLDCIGRYGNLQRRTAFGTNSEGPGPCDYSSGGLFNVNPVRVSHEGRDHYVFELAPPVTA